MVFEMRIRCVLSHSICFSEFFLSSSELTKVSIFFTLTFVTRALVHVFVHKSTHRVIHQARCGNTDLQLPGCGEVTDPEASLGRSKSNLRTNTASGTLSHAL